MQCFSIALPLSFGKYNSIWLVLGAEPLIQCVLYRALRALYVVPDAMNLDWNIWYGPCGPSAYI